MANFWLILLTIYGVNSSLIWDPECEGKECSGSPDRGDGLTNFDDWDGSTRTYGTKITYTCAEGFAFDLKGFPSKIENYCGKKCEGWSIGSHKKCFLNQNKSDEAGCRISGPEWSNKDGKLPRCVLRTTRWKKSVGNNSFVCPLFSMLFFFQRCATQLNFQQSQIPLLTQVAPILRLEQERQSSATEVTISRELQLQSTPRYQLFRRPQHLPSPILVSLSLNRSLHFQCSGSIHSFGWW